MKLMRVGNAGEEVPLASIDGSTWLDVSSFTRDFDASFFSEGKMDVLEGQLSNDVSSYAEFDPVGIRVGSCIAVPHQVLCVGLNYTDHAVEAGMPIPEEPILFNKSPNTVIGPNDNVRIPRGSKKTDWEVELGIVIGARARYLQDKNEAWSHIAGFCISNDVSERSFQLERGGQWVKGKSCETFNPCGPWLVSKNDVNPSKLGMSLKVNGVQKQVGSTATMIHGPAEIVRYVSQFMVLEPGDLINTGTPPGVGMGFVPPQYLRAGDVMELSIEGLGTQRQLCIDTESEDVLPLKGV